MFDPLDLQFVSLGKCLERDAMAICKISIQNGKLFDHPWKFIQGKIAGRATD